jgi:beta-galactosidase
MMNFTRRGLLQSTAAISAAGSLNRIVTAQAAAEPPGTSEHAAPGPRETLLLDFGWRFHLGHAQDPARDFGFGLSQKTYAKSGAGVSDAAAPTFDDSGWAKIDLPHDWAVALPFVPSANADPKAEEDPRAEHGFKPLGREYPETSIGWYRRSFAVPASDLGRRLSLAFDGVFRDCMVVLNGHIVATQSSGYVPFDADITDFVNYGGTNTLVVRVDATLGEGWYYEGAGIYRHVWLVKTDAVHAVRDGTVVRSAVNAGGAQLSLSSEVVNRSDTPKTCQMRFAIEAPNGSQVRTASVTAIVAPGQTKMFEKQLTLAAPQLWSLESPALYALAADVLADGRVTDRITTTFGIRTIRFDPALGFFLNGKPVKLKGTCNHQDHVGVGSALPDRIHAFRIEKLKEMGSNAYRTAHNPPAPELLDACDRLGMLVIDETRTMSSDAEGIGQLTRMIRRDRNHPSVILWSIGNEEQAQQGTELGARIARSMKQVCTALDPTRPITAAMDHEWGKGISPVLDVVGFNYRTDQIEPFHRQFPQQATIGTETGSTVSTRGCYVRDDAKGYVVAYDTEFPSWASTAEAWWSIVADRPYIAGGFVWTGFDYRGEPTPFNKWPSVSSQFGIMDTCGFPKDNYYYYQAWWQDRPVVHLLPHWNWPGREGQAIKVWCHSNLDSVELFLNGQSQGVRKVVANTHVEWEVPYRAGAIEAKGYRNGALVASDRRETTGPAASIRLSADRQTIDANGEDVAMLMVEIVDAQGRVVPDAADSIVFRITGPGVVIGVGNGDPSSHEPDKASQRRAFNGLCAAIVQASRQPGPIRIEATAPGLASAAIVVAAQPAAQRPYVA